MPSDDREQKLLSPDDDGVATATAASGTDDATSAEDRHEGRISEDLVGGVVMLAFAAVFVLSAGSGTLDWIFPLSLGYGLGVIGLYLTVRGLLGYGKKTETLVPVLHGKGIDVFVFSLITAAYVALARVVGFWIMSIVMLFAGAIYLDSARTRKRVVLALVVAFGVCIAAYLILRRVFFVPVPRARWLPF